MTKTALVAFLKKHRIDIIVIVSLLLLSLTILGFVYLTKKDGAYAEVTIEGEVVGKYSLAIDGVYTLNGGTNILTVENGSARMTYSSCPDHLCENTGSVRYVGQTVVCLPNRLAITIIGNSDNAVDFVS